MVSFPRDAEALHARLAAIVISSDDGIISKDLRGVVQSWNAAAERIFGWSANEMIGEELMRIVPPERRDEELDILARLAQGERIEHFRTERTHKSGRRIFVSITVSPICDPHGRVIGASKIVRDTPTPPSSRRATTQSSLPPTTRSSARISMASYRAGTPPPSASSATRPRR
jgi:PAS domain S-box-containing protein